jgi:hypothetical protein
MHTKPERQFVSNWLTHQVPVVLTTHAKQSASEAMLTSQGYTNSQFSVPYITLPNLISHTARQWSALYLTPPLVLDQQISKQQMAMTKHYKNNQQDILHNNQYQYHNVQ